MTAVALSNSAYQVPYKGYPTDTSYVLDNLKMLSGETDNNKIKLSISECTRALLRRVPRQVFVNSLTDPDVKLILTLCEEENVKVTVYPDISPYKAAAILV